MCNCGTNGIGSIAYRVMLPDGKTIVVDNEPQARGAVVSSGCRTCGWEILRGDAATQAREDYQKALREQGGSGTTT